MSPVFQELQLSSMKGDLLSVDYESSKKEEEEEEEVEDEVVEEKSERMKVTDTKRV